MGIDDLAGHLGGGDETFDVDTVVFGKIVVTSVQATTVTGKINGSAKTTIGIPWLGATPTTGTYVFVQQGAFIYLLSLTPSR